MELTFSKIDWNQEPNVREKVFFLIILLLIAFAFSRLLWFPTFDKIKKRSQEIKTVKLQITTLEKFIDINKKMKKQKKTLQKKTAVNTHLEEVLKRTPSDPQKAIAEVIREITSRGRLGSVTLNTVSFDTPVVQGGYARIPILLNVEGAFSALQNYLSGLEKIYYFFTVDNIKVSSSEEHPGLIKADLKCSLYLSAAGIETTLVNKDVGKGKKSHRNQGGKK